ncbi:MAG: MBL fold metallo-hydrolase [Spirochaetaceae bacterium]|jgi:glyoxylase-like metal-dependent hydrolase (beta-lactamase superfamily II)|nr:MBL fold metallo-hydrolase [Spirochaetaceae bacterium]
MTELVTFPTGDLAVNTYFIPLIKPCGSGPVPVIVADPGDSGEQIVKELRTRNMRAVAVALTHRHFDHVLGLAAVCGAFPGIPVGIHPADKNGFGPDMDQAFLTEMRLYGIAGLGEAMQGLPAPDVLLGEGAALDKLIPQETPELRAAAALWRTLHTPGHTPGSVCFYNQTENLLLSGDTLFRGTWGRTDLTGGSEKDMRASLKRLFELPDNTRVFTGHEAYGFSLAMDKY